MAKLLIINIDRCRDCPHFVERPILATWQAKYICDHELHGNQALTKPSEIAHFCPLPDMPPAGNYKVVPR